MKKIDCNEVGTLFKNNPSLSRDVLNHKNNFYIDGYGEQCYFCSNDTMEEKIKVTLNASAVILDESTDKCSKNTVVLFPSNDKSDINVYETIFEEKEKGYIIERTHRVYGFQNTDERILRRLDSSRSVWKESNAMLCNEDFETRFIDVYTDDTITKINGLNISDLYNIVDSKDKVYLISNLYKGVIPKNMDAEIYETILGFNYKERVGFTGMEEAISVTDTLKRK